MKADMRARRKVLLLKIAGTALIVLLILRADWLGLAFNGPSHNNERHHQHHHVHHSQHGGGESVIRQLIANSPKPTPLHCGIPHMQNMLTLPDRGVADCVRIQPDDTSCVTAHKMFNKKRIPDPCYLQESSDYCSLKESSLDSVTVECHGNCDGQKWELGQINQTTGEIVWSTYRTNSQLEDAISLTLTSDHAGYCLIQCASPDNLKCLEDGADVDPFLPTSEELTHSDYCNPPQILNLPPFIRKANIPMNKPLMNFNFIFIDSVSRHHFYRSLPKTVNTLDEMNSRDNKDKLMVLDFELVQGVRSRTFETLQALFSGSIDPYTKPFGTQEMPKVKLKIEDLLKPLKKLNYHSLWLEDLCPYWEWGISKDLLVYNKSLNRTMLWKNLHHRLRQAGIDSIGNTFASCMILNQNHKPDPFHGPDDLCYNKLQQHEYHLSYLKLYQQKMQLNNQQFFTFFETNQGHEDAGLRIQYLDTALAQYVEFTKNLTNTMTVIFSDHGNAYGPYIKASSEGRLETYHPFMFFILPRGVKNSSVFTKQRLNSLIVNQKRLINILDVHYTIKYIIHNITSSFNPDMSEFNKQFNVSSDGLLSPISAHRTCSLVPRIMPNLCICEGYDVTFENHDFHYMLAVYFVGMLNNEIQRQRLEGSNSSYVSDTIVKGGNLTDDHGMYYVKGGNQVGGFGTCHRLKVGDMKNIQENHVNDEESLVKMDLYVTSPDQFQTEIFFITILVEKQTGKISTRAFERITPYSIHAYCADKGVDLQLCVCASLLDAEKKSGVHVFAHFELPKTAEEVIDELVDLDLEVNVSSLKVDGKECLYLVKQFNSAGVNIDLINHCNWQLELTVIYRSVNLLMSELGDKVKIRLFYNDVKHLLSGIVKHSEQAWSCDLVKYDYSIT